MPFYAIHSIHAMLCIPPLCVCVCPSVPFSIRCSLENFTVFNGSDVTVECVLPRLYMARALNGVLQQDKKYVHKERHNSTHSRLVFKWPAVTRSSVTCFSVAGEENSQTCITVTVRCQPLPDPQHGHAMVKVATRGRKVFFRCDEGYHLLGSKMRRCVSTTSTWDGVQPVCIGESIHMYTCMCSCAQTHTHTHMITHKDTHTHTHTNTHTHNPHTHTHTLPHTHTPTHTHSHTHPHTQKQTHTHTHTIYMSQLCLKRRKRNQYN